MTLQLEIALNQHELAAAEEAARQAGETLEDWCQVQAYCGIFRRLDELGLDPYSPLAPANTTQGEPDVRNRIETRG